MDLTLSYRVLLLRSKRLFCKNFRSVEAQILHEVDQCRYVFSSTKTLIVSTLGAIPKSDSEEVRLLHDCSWPHSNGINAFLEDVAGNTFNSLFKPYPPLNTNKHHIQRIREGVAKLLLSFISRIFDQQTNHDRHHRYPGGSGRRIPPL